MGCDECQHMYCLLQRILPAEIHLAPPLEWARTHFATPVPETNAKVRHYVVVVEADGLDFVSVCGIAGGKSELLVPETSSGAVSCNRSSTRCCP